MAQDARAMSIGRDTTYNLAAAIAPALFMLGVIPFYLHVIGPERFGVLAICWTMVAALRFASLGMGPALTYRLATMEEAHVDARSSLVWTALILAFAASLVGAAVVVGIAEIYFRYFFAPTSALDAEIRQALPLLAALLPAGIIIGVLNGALQGVRRFGALSVINILNAALLAILPLAVATLFSVRLDALILAMVMANAAIAVIELTICGRLVPLRLPKLPKGSDAKALLGYGAWMSGTALISPLVLLLDRFVIGALRGPAAVAVYVLPFNLVQQLILLPASFTTAVLPRLAPLRDEEVQQLQSSSLIWLNGVLSPLAIVAIALAPPFFHVWIGPTLAKVAGPVAVVLMVGGWVHGIGHVPSTMLLARSRPDVVTKLLLAYVVPYVVILYFATLHFGVIGAAATWTFRAAFDPILFFFTRPYASDMWRVVVSAALVLVAMVAALALPWTSVTYWALMLVIGAAACYQNRRVLITSAANLLHVAFVRRGRSGEVVIGDNGL
jgi:O-antigen/teichoic acid export membrane protein